MMLGAHDPAGGYRGGKYSAFEAGTRVPMVVRWPEQIKAGQTSGAMICQVDFCACFASIVGGTNRALRMATIPAPARIVARRRPPTR